MACLQSNRFKTHPTTMSELRPEQHTVLVTRDCRRQKQSRESLSSSQHVCVRLANSSVPDSWRRVPCEQQLDSSESPDSCDGSPCFVFCCSSLCYDSSYKVHDVDTSLLCSTFRPLSTQKEARSQTHVNDSNHFRLFDTECLQVVSSQSTKVCHSASAVPLCQVGTLRVSSACWSKATSAREDRIDVWPCGREFSSFILLIQSWWSSQVGTCGTTPASDNRDTMASVHFSVSGFFQA